MKLPARAMAVALLCTSAGASALAQGWQPQKNVEIVAASAPGGSNDNTARPLERILLAHKLINTTLTVVNEPGGVAASRAHMRDSARRRSPLSGHHHERAPEQPHHRLEHAEPGGFPADRVARQ